MLRRIWWDSVTIVNPVKMWRNNNFLNNISLARSVYNYAVALENKKTTDKISYERFSHGSIVRKGHLGMVPG